MSADLPKPRHRLSLVDEVSRTATCSVCGPVSIRLRSGQRGHQCMTTRRADRARNPPTNLAKRRGRYRLSVAALDALVLRAGGRCEICQCDLHFDDANIDHDHETRAVRGLLCRTCNIGLGYFRDDPELMTVALQYLKRGGPPEARAESA